MIGVSQEKMGIFIQKCETWLNLIKNQNWHEAIKFGIEMEKVYPNDIEHEDPELDKEVGLLVSDIMEYSEYAGPATGWTLSDFQEKIQEFKDKYHEIKK